MFFYMQMIHCVEGPTSKLTSIPQMKYQSQKDFQFSTTRSEDREQEENRKNRRKECVIQGQRACARIGHCLVRVLACVFD